MMQANAGNQLAYMGLAQRSAPTAYSIRADLLERKQTLEAELNPEMLEAKRVELRRVLAALEAIDVK